MTIPRWTTIVLFAGVVMNFIMTWLQAKKTGTSFRESVLPSALVAGAVSIIFVREVIGDIGDRPRWIDIPFLILLSSIISYLLGLSAVRLTRFLRESWRLDDKENK